MFSLVMSHIHDEPGPVRDSDSFVPYIEDGLVAIQAFQSYVARLSETYGIEFTLEPEFSADRPLAAFAAMPDGKSTVYVELQRPKLQTDHERIVDLMVSKARFTG